MTNGLDSSTGARGAIRLATGGSVGNSGTISGGLNGVYVTGGAGTVTNADAITGTSNDGVFLNAGGTVTNQSGGTISGGSNGVYSSPPADTVDNQTLQEPSPAAAASSFRRPCARYSTRRAFIGTESFSTARAPLLKAAARSTTRSGMISGEVTGVAISNWNGLRDQRGRHQWRTAFNSIGVVLNTVSGGSVDNQSTGTIEGGEIGVLIAGDAATVTNEGAISGAAAAGVLELQVGGTVVNTGSIAGLATTASGARRLCGRTFCRGHQRGTISEADMHRSRSWSASAFTLTLQTGSTLNGDAIGSTFGTNALSSRATERPTDNFVNFTTLNDATGDWNAGWNEIFSGGASVAIVGLDDHWHIQRRNARPRPPSIPPIPSAFIDTGAVTITGNVGNAGHLTINGVTMTVGGTFTQLPGGTTTLLAAASRSPNVVIEGGVFGGSGKVDGEVSVTGGTVQPGAEPGGSLTVKGDYSQTGGEIVFEVDPNPLELGGFLETTLILRPRLLDRHFRHHVRVRFP